VTICCWCSWPLLTNAIYFSGLFHLVKSFQATVKHFHHIRTKITKILRIASKDIHESERRPLMHEDVIQICLVGKNKVCRTHQITIKPRMQRSWRFTYSSRNPLSEAWSPVRAHSLTSVTVLYAYPQGRYNSTPSLTILLVNVELVICFGDR
jgi:hypothetical protein